MKYIFRYLVFWVPALLATLLLPGGSQAAQAAQLFCAFFMLFGWGINSGMSAFEYPRKTFGGILIYLGVSLVLVTGLYSGFLPRLLGSSVYVVTGLLSFYPLDIFIVKTIDLKIPHELYIVAGLSVICVAGWLFGLICRFRARR